MHVARAAHSGEGSTAGDWEALERALLDFGRRELGCSALTPPWLSSYVSGMQQEWHTDNVHGPWAFVLSLTHWDERKFSGGETELLTQQTLDYWSTSGASSGVAEAPQLVERVEPLFNRLTLFDPRLPHGVREVQGEMDPRKGRLVLHGWFTEPVPYYEVFARTRAGECLSAPAFGIPPATNSARVPRARTHAGPCG